MSTSSERAHRAAATTVVVVNPSGMVVDLAVDCDACIATMKAMAERASKTARQATAAALCAEAEQSKVSQSPHKCCVPSRSP